MWVKVIYHMYNEEFNNLMSYACCYIKRVWMSGMFKQKIYMMKKCLWRIKKLYLKEDSRVYELGDDNEIRDVFILLSLEEKDAMKMKKKKLGGGTNVCFCVCVCVCLYLFRVILFLCCRLVVVGRRYSIILIKSSPP